ncbi:site-2 protease family protein [Candidatus Woesearchaeota archaeon]|nr:site-2 protease family protein [Candidatus Woesearchaeota archaeon]
MDVFQYILQYKTLIFYLLVLLFVFLNRKRFEMYAKVFALYRTKIGLKLMKKVGKQHRELVKILGYCGIGIAFIGMIFITYTLIKNPVKLLTVEGAQSEIALVYPGVNMPGSPIVIPLFSGWIALFIVILIHEFSHGIVALAHNIKIKSSGIMFIGPLMGAFVEPDEKQLNSKSDVAKYSVFAAGPFSNILLGVLSLIVISTILVPCFDKIAEPVGFSFATIEPDSPAARAQLQPGDIITKVNGIEAYGYLTLTEQINSTAPGEVIVLSTTTHNYNIITVKHPETPGKAYIGISGIKNKFELKQNYEHFKLLKPIALITGIATFFELLALLGLGLGLGNLIPGGPVDGGKILAISLEKVHGKKKGKMLWIRVTSFMIFLFLLNIALTILKAFWKS